MRPQQWIVTKHTAPGTPCKVPLSCCCPVCPECAPDAGHLLLSSKPPRRKALGCPQTTQLGPREPYKHPESRVQLRGFCPFWQIPGKPPPSSRNLWPSVVGVGTPSPSPSMPGCAAGLVQQPRKAETSLTKAVVSPWVLSAVDGVAHRGRGACYQGAVGSSVRLQAFGGESQECLQHPGMVLVFVFSGLHFHPITGPQSKGSPSPSSILGLESGAPSGQRQEDWWPRPQGRGQALSSRSRVRLLGYVCVAWREQGHQCAGLRARGRLPSHGRRTRSAQHRRAVVTTIASITARFLSREWFSEMWKSSRHGSQRVLGLPVRILWLRPWPSAGDRPEGQVAFWSRPRAGPMLRSAHCLQAVPDSVES